MLNRFKKKINSHMAKFVYVFVDMGVDPNTITILGLVSAIAATISAYFKHLILLTIFTAISMFMDVADGMVARLANRVTPFGGVLDSFCDRVEEALYIVSLILIGLPTEWGIAALILSYLVSYLRALGELRGVKVEGVGIVERPERLLLIIATLILALVFQNSSIYREVLVIPITVLVVLSVITVVQRFSHIYRSLKNV